MPKEKKTGHPADLHVINLALAIGTAVGLAMLILGSSAWLLGYGTRTMMMVGRYYAGSQVNFISTVAGAIWGFFHGFIAGAVVAWLYNTFNKLNQ